MELSTVRVEEGGRFGRETYTYSRDGGGFGAVLGGDSFSARRKGSTGSREGGGRREVNRVMNCAQSCTQMLAVFLIKLTTSEFLFLTYNQILFVFVKVL